MYYLYFCLHEIWHTHSCQQYVIASDKMKPTIDFILVYEPQNAHCAETIETILNTDCVNQLFLIVNNEDAALAAQAFVAPNGKRCNVLQTDTVNGTKFLRLIAPKLEAKFTIYYLSTHDLQLGYRAIERLMQTAEYQAANFNDNEPESALMLYSDRYDSKVCILRLIIKQVHCVTTSTLVRCNSSALRLFATF